jgi:TolB-like protein/DNA-binding winged helix-turn-helix (wHTH) protein
LKTPSDAPEGGGSTLACPNAYRAGDLLIDLTRERVTRDGTEIQLPRLSFLLLKALLRSAPGFVSVPALMDEVWPRLVVGPDTVSQRVKLLRTALGDDGRARRYVEAARGRGYRLAVAAIPLCEAPAAPAPAAKMLPLRSRMLRALRVVVVTVLIAGTVWQLYLSRIGTTDTSTVRSSHLRLAVLPLENLSPDSDQAFFADGVHEDILTSIADGIPELEVVSRTTMMTYRDRRTSIRQLARDTGCSHVLEGTVRRDGESIRLTLQLIDAVADRPVWTHQYDRKPSKSISLQSEIAAQVARQLSVRLDPARQGRSARTSDPVAYDLYLKTRLAMRPLITGATREHYDVARRLADQAIAQDANFGLPYLARAYVAVQAATTLDPRHALLPAVAEARRDVEVARRLLGDDPAVIATSAWLSYLEDGMNAEPRAAREWERAAAAGLRDPRWLTVRAAMLSDANRLSEALPILAQQSALDPGNPQSLVSYQQALDGARRPAESLRVLGLMDDRLHIPVAPLLRGRLIFSYTGRSDALRAALEGGSAELAPETQLGAQWGTLLLERRFADAERLLARTSIRRLQFPMLLHGGPLGDSVEVARGWTYQLAGKTAAAASVGRRLLREAAIPSPHEPGPYQRLDQMEALMIRQQALLFTGQKAEALDAVRESLALAQSMSWHPIKTAAIAVASMVMAWSGAQDEAVDLLVQLSIEAGGLSPNEYPLTPGVISRSPIYTVPLAGNAHFRALVQRLESEMPAADMFGGPTGGR